MSHREFRTCALYFAIKSPLEDGHSHIKDNLNESLYAEIVQDCVVIPSVSMILPLSLSRKLPSKLSDGDVASAYFNKSAEAGKTHASDLTKWNFTCFSLVPTDPVDVYFSNLHPDRLSLRYARHIFVHTSTA